MSRLLLALVPVLALVAAGCGGGSNSSSETTTVTETAMQQTTASETTSTGTTGSGDVSKILADKDCQALIAAGATVAQAFAGASGTSNTESSKELEQLAAKVPDEIKADVDTLSTWYASYAAKLKKIGIKAGETPSAAQLQELQSAITSSGTQDVQKAAEHLTAWANKNCSQ